jgi:hypothetical protein
MRYLALALLLVPLVCRSEPAPSRWVEFFHVYAMAPGVNDADLIDVVDTALKPLGFVRNSKGTRYPMASVPGIFASYTTNGPAAVLIVEASRVGCISLAVTNYERRSAGLAEKAGTAMRSALTAHFPRAAVFYSDAQCKVAL